MDLKKKQTKNTDENSRIDYGIIFSVMVLALIGLMSIYVAASHDNGTTGSPTQMVMSQLIWYFLGAVGVVIIMHFDAQQLWMIAPYAYSIGIFLLVAVLFFYSRDYAAKTGAKSWFALGPFSFQPSELMKPAFILMLGRVVTEHNHNYHEHTLHSDQILIGKMILWSLPVIVLMLLQKDFGTMLVFLAILAGTMLVSGIDWRIILGLVIIASALMFAAIS